MDSMNIFLPSRGPLEVVFSFDTTGSMCRWLDELRGRIQDMIQRLQADIPGIKMAVFAHGDYCDSDIYVTQWVDLTSGIVKLCEFVQNAGQTGGGDDPECYELVLRQVRTELSWTPGSRRVLVMIGDNNPHEPEEPCNIDKIDWRLEVKALAQETVTIYGVQCGSYADAEKFYKAISVATGGKHLRLEDFGSLFDTLMAVCYREGNDTALLANYEKEVRARCVDGGSLAADIDAIFANLRDDDVDTSTTTTVTPLKPLKPLTTRMTGIPAKVTKPHTKTIKVAKAARKPKTIKLPSKRKTSPWKQSLNKFKEGNLPLLKRENVPENNFSLRSLNWSPWKRVMVSKEELPKETREIWVKRFGRPGYKIKLLSLPRSAVTQRRRRPALFEVAVQGNGANKKRYVVFSAFSSLCFGVQNWERRLLGVTRSQVDNVLTAGGRVYLRFSFIDSKTLLDSSRRNIRRYDYAWRKVRQLRSSPRDVVRASFTISKTGI